jgi:hypothetical protein
MILWGEERSDKQKDIDSRGPQKMIGFIEDAVAAAASVAHVVSHSVKKSHDANFVSWMLQGTQQASCVRFTEIRAMLLNSI